MSYQQIAIDAARTAGIDPNLFTRLIQQESGFNPSAVSPAGAQGIAQFMPGTAADLGIDPNDPEAALYASASLLREYLDRFGSYELALAAYNAGPGAVEQYRGVPPYAETQQYLASILGSADAAPRGATTQRRSAPMVSPPSSAVTIPNYLERELERQWLLAQGNQGLQAGGLTGMLDTGSGILPTLALRQYESSRQDADRNYEVDLARFGLQQAEFNYTQRLSEAQLRLQTMQTLASMRGPENAFAYNYALNGLNAPAGTPADPTSNITAGVNQPSNVQPQRPAGGGAGGVAVAPALGAKPPVAPLIPPTTLPKQPPGYNSTVPGQPGGFLNPVTDNNPGTNWIDPANQGDYNAPGGSYDDPNQPGYGTYEDLNQAQQSAGGAAIAPPTEHTPGTSETIQTPGGGSYTVNYGRGGAPGQPLPGGGSAAVVGDDPQGGDDENEELAIAIDDNLIVLSKQADGKYGISPKTLARFKDAGGPQAATGGLIAGQSSLGESLNLGNATYKSDLIAQPTGSSPAPDLGNATLSQDLIAQPVTSSTPQAPAATYSDAPAPLPTGPVTYSPQEIGGSPLFAKLAGQRFGAPRLDTTLPGSGTNVPAYQNLNLARFGGLAPSEQGLYKSALETPRGQGGLGLSFLDSLAVARRYAPTGSGARGGFYGR